MSTSHPGTDRGQSIRSIRFTRFLGFMSASRLKHALWLTCAAWSLLLIWAAGPWCALSAAPLNVLLIVTDDMNNDLGCYGNDVVRSPHIDALAKRGMLFERAYCQVTLCNPSRVSFLSGLRPHKTQVYTLQEPTRSHLGDWVMLPEYFRQHGFFTAQLGKIYHTGDGFEDPRSWDLELREFGKRPPPDQIIKSDDPDGPGQHTNDWSWLKTADADTPDGIVARRAVALLRERAEDPQPFFLGVGFRRPHAPFAAPKPYFDLYPPEKMQLPLAAPPSHLAGLPVAAINYPAPDQPLTERQQRELIAAYYACNSFVDAQVGVILAALDELALWQNTAVVFVSDHGYHLGDHGGLWHKLSLFEEAARVPLVIYAPGMKAAGQTCSQLVEMIDLYPTLADLAGLEIPSGLDGADLRGLLDDPHSPVKEAAYTLVARAEDPQANHAKINDFLGRSLRTDRWRYTEWDNGQRGIELYDHENDPHEWHNLADDPASAETRQRLRELLAKELVD